MPPPEPRITIHDLTMAYGSFVIQHDLTFRIQPGEIFIIMGGSGCGKSTLLRHLIGLMRPATRDIRYAGASFWAAPPADRERMLRRFGVLYQSGALWSSMTLAENVALPLGEYTALSPREIREVVGLKLALVGLAGFEDFYPAEISGGMRKRAGLARAMALDPDILFFDEPSAGLDPLSSRQKLLRDVDGQVAPLAGGAKETLTSAKEALTAARSALAQAQKSLGTLTEAATPVLKQADKTLAGTTALTGPDSAVLNDLSRTLRALDEAARAIRTLAGVLERNPEMLIRGRSK
jgi:phospholipid/cholesterol/gamma-HCH transport system ATP-binding protein